LSPINAAAAVGLSSMSVIGNAPSSSSGTNRGAHGSNVPGIKCEDVAVDPYFKFNTPFGYMLASNITPDPATGIGRWTADDFYRALHAGVNQHGQDMYPDDAV